MKRYLIFGAISPFIGGFLLLFATTYQSGYFADTNLREVAKLFVMFGRTLQYSYLFAIVPALMLAAVDDILMHIRAIKPVLRMLIIGAIAFVGSEFLYGQRGPDTGLVQFILYGLVGFVPTTISSWVAHLYAEDPDPARTGRSLCRLCWNCDLFHRRDPLDREANAYQWLTVGWT